MHQLALRLIAKAKTSDDPNDEPLRALDWWYPEDESGEPKMEAVLAEINGWKTTPSGQLHHGPQLDKYQELKGRRHDRVRLLDLLRRLRQRRREQGAGPPA